MRVVVTGAGNPYGQAIVDALLAEGAKLRLFGCTEEEAARWPDVAWFPGRVATLGSIEPVLAEREILVHAASLDAPGKDKSAHAVHISRGTLAARYGAERELMDLFVHVTPAKPTKQFATHHAESIATAEGCHKVPVAVVKAGHPDQTAAAVLDAVKGADLPGRMPGRETDALVV